MPWKEVTTMSLREEFVKLATEEGANRRALCRQFGITPRTGYKWLRRFEEEGVNGLADRSRRPLHSPQRTDAEMEAQIVAVRERYPTWGARKIRAFLHHQGITDLPSPSTITAILDRHQQISPQKSAQHRPYRRFAMEEPNQLWQMDFKGYFQLGDGQLCHPLTILDDCSRFLVGLFACPDEKASTVQEALTEAFRTYGLPERMLMDNGSPWGDKEGQPYTVLTVWLIRLGIRICHGRPYHPQTLGKDERLHRTLQEDLLSREGFANLADAQRKFDEWRVYYNEQRPHEALEMHPPATRYQPSPRPFPEVLPPVLYEPEAVIRRVDQGGRISFRNRIYRIGKAFRHQIVAVRPSEEEGKWDVFFGHQRVAQIDLRKDNS